MQRSFAAGEIGPTLYGGREQQRYQEALATCRNFIVMRHGGATMRPGTQYVATVKDSTVTTYLLKFVFNDTDAFIIEAGNQYFRFVQLGAQVLSGGVPLEVVTPWNASDIPLLKWVQSNNVITFTHPNYQPQQLKRSGGVWSLTAFTTAPWHAAPTGVVATPGAAGALNPKYVVTAQNTGTYEETVGSSAAT